MINVKDFERALEAFERMGKVIVCTACAIVGGHDKDCRSLRTHSCWSAYLSDCLASLLLSARSCSPSQASADHLVDAVRRTVKFWAIPLTTSALPLRFTVHPSAPCHACARSVCVGNTLAPSARRPAIQECHGRKRRQRYSRARKNQPRARTCCYCGKQGGVRRPHSLGSGGGKRP